MEVTLPLLGDVMTEGTVARWLQPEGALVAEGSPLYQVETDKVNLTVDAPAAGRLERLVPEGETVPVGAVVARLVGDASATHGLDEVRATPAARAAARRLGIDLRQIVNGRRLREADVLRHAESSASTALSGRRKVIAERMRSSLAQSAQVTVLMALQQRAFCRA